MKKQLRKPENWQDFEGLCKKLWGEIWQVPHKIKKNGRLGQPQAGIDVYAIPKGENNYYGIQCKGKDEYINAKLTKPEIENEIEKARLFQPKLDVFIFATTANKDAKIEEFIRLKDIESRKNNDFEILLYSWEDIVDLIEENRDTFNYYVNLQQYKETHDFEVYFDNHSTEITIEPIFIEKITKCRLKSTIPESKKKNKISILDLANRFKETDSYCILRDSNEAICKLPITMVNTGNKVLENWKAILEVEESSFQSLQESNGISLEIKPNLKIEDNIIIFGIKTPLVQTDKKHFEAWIEPFQKEYRILVKWSIVARDFNKGGDLTIYVYPKYERKIKYIDVGTVQEMKPDVTEIKPKKYYSEDDEDRLSDWGIETL